MSIAAITSEIFYTLIGIVFILTGAKAVADHGMKARGTTVAFWFVLAFTFIAGPWLPAWVTGACVLIIAVLTAVKGVRQSKSDVPDEQTTRKNADKLGYKIFIPVLALAVVAIPAAMWLPTGPNNAIGVASIVSVIVILLVTRAPAKNIVTDGTRLMDNVGPVGILPQLLAALGALFTAAGVGNVISGGISAIVPEGNRLIACAVYCIGMALFTIIMGNAFAAFSVITVGIGIPFLIMQGANPVVVGAMGLTAGYCGTLVTPMAANFNIMPAALLETNNKYIIIKQQAIPAMLMLVIHIILMYILAF